MMHKSYDDPFMDRLTSGSNIFQKFSLLILMIGVSLVQQKYDVLMKNYAESCIRPAGYSTKLEEGLSLNDSNTGSRIPRG